MKKEYYECDVCGDTVEHYGVTRPEGWVWLPLDGFPELRHVKPPTEQLGRDVCPKHTGDILAIFVRFNEREANGENVNPKKGQR